MLPNYTGPYRSDGKFQESVEFGPSPPLSELDALSRYHDSAYAHYKDVGHRMAADSIYSANSSKLGAAGKTAGALVTYGNQTLRAGSELFSDTRTYGPFGFVYGVVKNGVDLYDYMLNADTYKKDVLSYYATDPGWEQGNNTDDEIYMHRRFVGDSDEPVDPEEAPVRRRFVDPSADALPSKNSMSVYQPYSNDSVGEVYHPVGFIKRRRKRRRNKTPNTLKF